MTTISETIQINPGEPYTRVVPVQQATDTGVDKCLAIAMREFLHRHGVNVSTVTDDQLVNAAREGVESVL